MWDGYIVKSRGKINVLALRMSLSLAVGLVASALMLGLVLMGSDGTEPRGICKFVGGDAGVLPLNPNKGGTYSYSCDLNMALAALYILVPGMALSVLVYFVPRISLFARYPFTKRRLLGNDIESPATE